MFEDRLDSIEERMGERFRYALEQTCIWGLRIFSILVLIACAFFAFVFVAVAFMYENIAWLLMLIPCLLVAMVAMFGIFWTSEDW